jgi:hypothetical protein
MDQPSEFARVVGCARCDSATSRKLLRDDFENVPQPGFVGDSYRHRVALAGQTLASARLASQAGTPSTLPLRRVRDNPVKGT